MTQANWRYVVPIMLLSALLAGCQSASTNADRCRLLGDSPDETGEWNLFEFRAAHSTVKLCLPDSWEEASPQDIPKRDEVGREIEYFVVYDPGSSETLLDDLWRAAVWIWEDPTFFDPQLRWLFNKPTLADVARSRLSTSVALAEDAGWVHMMQEPKVVLEEEAFAVANVVLRVMDRVDNSELLVVHMDAYAATTYVGLNMNMSINGIHYQPGDEAIFGKFLSTLSVEEPE
jgi:hypothetical protein